NEAAGRGSRANRNVAPRMAFLRRSCKNVPGGTDQISMKAMMWRYRDVSKPGPIISLVLRRPWGEPANRDSLGFPERTAQRPSTSWCTRYQRGPGVMPEGPRDARPQLKQAS